MSRVSGARRDIRDESKLPHKVGSKWLLHLDNELRPNPQTRVKQRGELIRRKITNQGTPGGKEGKGREIAMEPLE